VLDDAYRFLRFPGDDLLARLSNLKSGLSELGVVRHPGCAS
jgi:hypothetical protein